MTTPGGAASEYYVRKTDTVFTWGVGGGLDVMVTKMVAFRLVDAQYLMIRPDGLSGKALNNLQLSTGIALRFGSK